MNQYVADTHVTNGQLELRNIPIKDNTECQSQLIPKAMLSKMGFRNAQRLTKPIAGNISDEIISDRASK